MERFLILYTDMVMAEAEKIQEKQFGEQSWVRYDVEKSRNGNCLATYLS